MRNLLFPVTLGLLLIPFTAVGLDRGRQLHITNTAHSTSLLNVLENAVWAKDGNSQGKIAYVIYSTECAWSRKLFQDTRGLQSDVELRWIPVAAQGADYVTEQRNSDAVALTFQGQTGPVTEADSARRAVIYNYGVLQSANYHFQPYANDRTFAYPTVMYQTAQGLKVIAGNPPDLQAMLSEIQPTPDKTQLIPKGVHLSQTPVTIKAVSTLKTFQNTEQTALKVYGAPSEQAPIIDDLQPGYGTGTTGLVAGTDWIEIIPYGPRGPRGYVQHPLTAKLSQLEFTVTPANGLVVAKTTKHILSHPDSAAPVLDTLEKGYQLDKTGEVTLAGKVWDVVVVYQDGTLGYIAR